MANGSKVFKNTTNQPLAITLIVRRGDNPGAEAGMVVFQLAPGQTLPQSYGTDTNSVYLDGIAVEVVTRSSPYDNVLNMNNTITFASGAGNTISISGSNS